MTNKSLCQQSSLMEIFMDLKVSASTMLSLFILIKNKDKLQNILNCVYFCISQVHCLPVHMKTNP